MVFRNNNYYIRTCQECGHRQPMIPPEEQKGDTWRDAKCRKCHSPALDYGSWGWIKSITGYVQAPSL